MSTLESTISMLEILPESDVQFIFDITKNLMEQRNPSSFSPITKKQILNDLETSTKQIEEGRYSTVDDVIERLKLKYGL